MVRITVLSSSCRAAAVTKIHINLIASCIFRTYLCDLLIKYHTNTSFTIHQYFFDLRCRIVNRNSSSIEFTQFRLNKSDSPGLFLKTKKKSCFPPGSVTADCTSVQLFQPPVGFTFVVLRIVPDGLSNLSSMVPPEPAEETRYLTAFMPDKFRPSNDI